MAKWQIIVNVEGLKEPSVQLTARAKKAAEDAIRDVLSGYNQFVHTVEIKKEGGTKK